MQRFPDWEERLAVYLDRVREEPFAWGTHDCALFAAGAIKAMTGVDPAEAFRGTYSDAAGAQAALVAHGDGTLERTARQWLGASKHVSRAGRGDIVARRVEGALGVETLALGLCIGQWCWFAGEEPGHAGLVSLPTYECAKAWTVG